MKSDFETILAIGAVAAGGYLVYKLAKPLTETASTVGESIGTAFTGAGTATSDILTGTAAPFGYFDAYLEGRSATDTARQTVLTDLYSKDATTQAVIKQGVIANEQTITDIAQTKETQASNKLSLGIFAANTTKQSLANNYGETVERKTEYGATVPQYLAKTFLPTQEVAQERRQAVIVPIKKTGSAIATATKKAATSIVNLFTKKR